MSNVSELSSVREELDLPQCTAFLLLQLCVPLVLQTLHMLASAPKLRAVAMRLMTTLWKKQVL